MKNKLLTTGTILLAVVSALPSANSAAPAKRTLLETPPPKTWYKLDQFARFENSEGLPAVSASAIGIYLDVFWQGMSLVKSPDIPLLPGVEFNSPPNCAAYSKLDLITLQQGQPSMMTNYPDSTIDHLDLKSFYYACAVGSEETVLGVPVACTIFIEGYADDQSTKPTVSQSFKYIPSGLSTVMFEAKVDPEFKGLKNVKFFVSNDTTVAALIDSVRYTVYSDKQF